MNAELQKIIGTLQAKPAVDAVLLTGSYGQSSRPYSDIDLVIILADNAIGMKSLYAWLDGTFADIFFFDIKDLEGLLASPTVPANTGDLLASLYVWTRKGEIQFDNSGRLTELKSRQIALEVPKEQQAELWTGINYNYVANVRYLRSGDPAYHAALELRLLYAVPQAITGYFSFRNIPWEGEKFALSFLEKNQPELYEAFFAFTSSANLQERFSAYERMVQQVLTPDFPLWREHEIFPQPKGRPGRLSEKELGEFWKDLIS